MTVRTLSAGRPPLLMAAVLSMLVGCVEQLPTADPPPDLATLTFGPPERWAEPLEDYQAAAEEALGHDDFLRGVHGLTVFEDLLFFGYGDANLNVGRDVPIEVRRFSDPADPTAWASEFTTDDEQIERLRPLGDRLVIPGVDATEDAWLGNAYIRTDGTWTKSRTLDQGVHVHDVARIGDALFACGSGSTPEEWDTSDIHFLVWRSDDAETFMLADRIQNPLRPGDSRCTTLATVGGDLYGFGYRTDDTFQIRGLVGARLEGGVGVLEELAWAEDLFVTDAVPVSADVALLNAVDIGAVNTWSLKRLVPDGVREIDAYAGRTALEIGPLDEGRALVLDVAGDTYPTTDLGDAELTISITDGWERAELVSWTTDRIPSALAAWRDGLYLGMANGRVERTLGTE